MRLSKSQRTLLTLGLIPVIAVVLGGGAVTVATIGGKLAYDFASQYAVPGNGVSIVTDIPVAVTPSHDGKVHVRVSGTYTNLKPSVDVHESPGNELQVSTACRGSGCRVDLAVELPGSAALKVTSSGAPVALVELAGDLRVDANNGAIAGNQLRSDEVSVSSHDGSVDLSFDRPPGSVVATTTNGSLRVLVPTGPYAIDAAAMSGSTQLDVPNDLGAARRLHLRTTNGSITVGPYD